MRKTTGRAEGARTDGPNHRLEGIRSTGLDFGLFIDGLFIDGLFIDGLFIDGGPCRQRLV
jgi:hypothetical protein